MVGRCCVKVDKVSLKELAFLVAVSDRPKTVNRLTTTFDTTPEVVMNTFHRLKSKGLTESVQAKPHKGHKICITSRTAYQATAEGKRLYRQIMNYLRSLKA